jgi:hypothetical protein
MRLGEVLALPDVALVRPSRSRHNRASMRAVPPLPPTLAALAAAVAPACGAPGPARPAGHVDDDALARFAVRHRVAALARLSDELVQREVLTSLHVAAVQRRVVDALREEGIRFVVVKGLAVAAQGYAEPGARNQRDVDVLLAPGDAERAAGALLNAGLTWFGWRRPDDPDRAAADREALARLDRLPMLRDVKLLCDDVLVELHWRLFDNPHLMPTRPTWLTEPAHVEVHGQTTPTLPPADHLAYVLVHGTHHHWSLMKWLADVPALATRHPAAAEPRALLAAAPGNERALAAGLRVAETVFGPFLPPDTHRWAAGVRGTRGLVHRSLTALAAPTDRPKVVTPRTAAGEAAARLALRPDLAYRRDELRLLLLDAGRAHAVEDPGVAELLGGPLRWASRAVRRQLARG